MKWRDIERAKGILAQEEGFVQKDWGGRLPVALAYANTYRLGMSNLALHTLYNLLNQLGQVVCERVFWTQRPSEPIMTLESQRNVLDAAVLAVSLSFELDYLNLASMLHRAEVPLLASERDETYPLILAGGPAVTANPEPLSEICDAFVIGEAEEILEPLTTLLWEMLDAPRSQVLDALAQLSGVYVPGRSELPVRRLWVPDLNAYPTQTVIRTPNTEFGDMHLVEVSRGCPHGCRFCLAGHTYRPPRERSLESLLEQAREAAPHRERIGLVGAAISDYTRIDELVGELLGMGLRISVSSLRVRPLPTNLVAALAKSGVRTLTVAPEAGCERLRRVIKKGIEEEDILAAAELAEEHRFPALKLYFMIGLPGEVRDDVSAIADLVHAVKARFSGEISINATPLVPKAHTPFQWAGMAAPEDLKARIALLQEDLRPHRVQVNAGSVPWARVQGVLSRGDHRVGQALIDMRGRTSLKAWGRALSSLGLDEEMYLRERALGESLPWQVVDMGVTPTYLRREHQRAISALDVENPSVQPDSQGSRP